jgi:signal transduction histidine kinase
MWFSVQIAAYASLLVGYGLLLFMAVRRRDGRGRVQRYLEVLLILAAWWTLILGLLAILFSGAWWAYVWQRVAQIGLVILALTTAEFAELFLRTPSHRRLRLAGVIPLSLAAIIADLLPLYVTPFPLARWISPLDLATVFWMLAWLYVSGTIWWASLVAYRSATGSKHRNRVRYIHASILAFAVGDALVLTGGVPHVYLGLTARWLGLVLATFAVLRYDLPDIRRRTFQGLRFAILWGLTAIFYIVAVLVTIRVLDTYPAQVSMGWVLLAVLLAATAADIVLRPHLRRVLDRALLGHHYDVQKALRAYSQQIALILDLDRLADTTLDWLVQTLLVERSIFFLLDPTAGDQVTLRALRSRAGPLLSPRTFRADNRFIAHFVKIGRPLSQYDIDMLTWFEVMPADERQWLQDLKLDLYVPVLVAGRPVALLALGPKAGTQPYSEDDLETLMILADQTGTALQNARLVDDLRAMQDDLQRLNAQLAETNRQLQRLDQTKADFIAIASHELRTPLSQIYGYTDILSSLPGDELSDAQAVHRFIQGISRGAKQLKQVVDAMVDVSLLETGTMVLTPMSFSVKGIVGTAVSAVSPAAQQRKQTIDVQDLGSLPNVEADSRRIEQVLVGLLTNAIKFTPDGGQIRVSGHTGASFDQGYVELTIADTGIGIEPEQQDLIFEKFFRGEETMLHSTDEVGFKGAGPGLGLAIARGIVEAHGGRIWVESPGRDEDTCLGSTFHVRLPVANQMKG